MSEISIEEIRQCLTVLNLGLDPAALDSGRPLREQGLDSLDMMNLLFQVEERFRLSITEEHMESGDWSSLEAITDRVNELYQGD